MASIFACGAIFVAGLTVGALITICNLMPRR